MTVVSNFHVITALCVCRDVNIIKNCLLLNERENPLPLIPIHDNRRGFMPQRAADTLFLAKNKHIFCSILVLKRKRTFKENK